MNGAHTGGDTTMDQERIDSLGAQIAQASRVYKFCPQCKGGQFVAQIMDGQGVVQGPCYCCLGDGRARALPAPNQKVTLMAQWAHCDGLVEGFEVSGMMVVPAEDGAYYVTRKNAMQFFGLVEVPPDVAALQAEKDALLQALEMRNRELNDILDAVPGASKDAQAALAWVQRARARASQTTLDRLHGVIELLECGRAGEAQERLAEMTSEAEKSMGWALP